MSNAAALPPEDAAATPPVVVKKYANRRLYNTDTSSYVTLESLAEMIRKGRDFVVYDARSGDDITRGVLTQIIVEEEGKGGAMLPTSFLRQLIGLYGDNMQTVVPRFLEQAMAAFAQQQQRIRRSMRDSMPFFPFGNLEEIGRHNVALMERAMSLFTPFYPPREGEAEDTASLEIQALRSEVELLRRQLDAARQGNEAPTETDAVSTTVKFVRKADKIT